jgi:UDP-N-acetylglucosamine 4-epimerase
VLVTGGAGFIGSNLVDRLLALGASKVRVLDNLETGKEANLTAARRDPRFEFVKGDVKTLDDCINACAGMNIVFHEAAMVSVPLSMTNPIKNHDINITGTLHMLMAAAEAGVERFVYASSAATYGMDPELPKRETMTRHYPSPYALSKGVDEDYAGLWASKPELGKGMTCVGLRYFNVYGPRQDPKSAYSGVISIFADRILRGESPTMFGDGNQTRDFVFVGDVVKANVLAGLATLPDGHTARVYNVGTGRAVTLNTLFETMRGILGSNLAMRYNEPRAGNIRYSLSNIDRIRTELGYEPDYTLEQGLSILLGV